MYEEVLLEIRLAIDKSIGEQLQPSDQEATRSSPLREFPQNADLHIVDCDQIASTHD